MSRIGPKGHIAVRLFVVAPVAYGVELVGTSSGQEVGNKMVHLEDIRYYLS